ncbi:MAG: hypothetical protein JSR39_06165 [Verrucomicrobia bacterium]|nr:hypothetical protein [Verrucomicrobiota bacterium]
MAFEIQQQAQQIADRLKHLESMVNGVDLQSDLRPVVAELGSIDEMAASLANLSEFAVIVEEVSEDVLQSIQESFQKVEALAAARAQLIDGPLGGDAEHSSSFQAEVEQTLAKCRSIYDEVLAAPGKTMFDAVVECEGFLRGRVVELERGQDASPKQLEQLGQQMGTIDLLYLGCFREELTKITETFLFSKKEIAEDFDQLLPLFINLNRFVANRDFSSEANRQQANQLVDEVRNTLSQLIVGVRAKSREQFLEAVASGNIDAQRQIFPLLLKDPRRSQIFINFLRDLNVLTRERSWANRTNSYNPVDVAPLWVRGQRAISEDAHPDDIAQVVRSVFPEDSSDREAIAQSLQEKLNAAMDPQQYAPLPAMPIFSSSSEGSIEPDVHQVNVSTPSSSASPTSVTELTDALLHKLHAVEALSTMGFFTEEENAIEILTEQVNALEQSAPEAVHLMYGLMYHMHVQFKKFQPHDDYGRAAFLNQFAHFSDRRIICNATPFERSEIIKRATIKALIGAIREAVLSNNIDQVRKLMDQLSEVEPNPRFLGAPGQTYPNTNLSVRLHYFLYDEHVKAGLDPSLRSHSDFGRVGFEDREGFSAPQEVKLAALSRLDQELDSLWMS